MAIGCLVFIVLGIIMMIGSWCSRDEDDNESVVEQTTEVSPKAEEEGLSRGSLYVRVLDNDALDQLRIEALDAGVDPGSMFPTYPPQGPMAIAILPVNSLDLDGMLKVLPLLCEVTVEKDPDRWAEYSEVRILNHHAYIGFAFPDFPDSCRAQRAGDKPMGIQLVLGEWKAQFPWKLATPLYGGTGADTIGYGDYAAPG